MQQRTALVTGSNRGIGFAICRALAQQGLAVVLTAREEAEGRRAEAELRAEGLDVVYYPLDVSSPRSIDACRGLLEKDGIEVDALINNAGIYPGSDAVSVELAMIDEAWAVNARGPWLLCQAFVSRMRQRGYGRVVNISSGGGAFSEALAPDHAAYAVSKAALNALSLCLARSLDGDIKVNAMCPGWVRTRMRGSGAPRSPEEAADTAVWLATLPNDGPSGGFFRIVALSAGRVGRFRCSQQGGRVMNGRSTNETDGISRRSFLQAGGGAAGAVIGAAAGLSAETPVMAETALGFAQAVTTRLSINGKPMSITHEARVSLLDLRRERLQMTGTKKGCNEGACGACTVLLGGERVNACMTLAASCDSAEVTTVEGLAGPMAPSTPCSRHSSTMMPSSVATALPASSSPPSPAFVRATQARQQRSPSG